MKNLYIFRSRISEAQFRHIVRLFSLDLNAVQIAELSGFSRVTVNRCLRARCIKGKRGRVHINGIEGFRGLPKAALASFSA